MLENVEWEACLLQPHRDEALERYVQAELGVVPPLFPYFALSPWMVRSLVGLGVPETLHVERRLSDVIGLVVAEDNSCRFCYAMQRTLMRVQGVSSARIRDLEESRFGASLEPHDALALEFARHVSRADPRLPEDRARLRSIGWGDDAILEIAFLAAAHVYLNRIATVPAIPVARIERVSRFPGLGLLAPLARRRLRHARSRTVLLPREQCSGPWSFLVEPLARLPAARVLRGLLDEACESLVLPRRTKLLVFAVVARTLACRHSEREAIRLLIDEGLDPETIGETLSHLHSPRLDRVDAAVVPFARETVRFRPVEIQRFARRLEPLLDEKQLVELIGVTALANAVGRLSVMLGA